MGGQKGASHKRVEVVLKLPQLQNLIKRDPSGYKEEFKQQHRAYISELEIFKLRPDKDSTRFSDLVTFLGHVAPCYKEECSQLPAQLMSLLEEHGTTLQPHLRVKLVQSLVLIRNRGLLNPTDLLQLFFRLFRIQDKTLRQLLFDHTVNDIKAVNLKARNEKMNKTLQGFMYTMLQDESEYAAKKSLDVMVELYRKRVWTDTRTVNVIASALESTYPKLVTTALNFFLNIENEMEDPDEGKESKVTKEINMHEHAKQTKAVLRKIQKQVNARKKEQNAIEEDKEGMFPAINLLNDPQGVAEKVFKRLRSGANNERFEVKLLMMNFIGRVIGAHSLIMLPFYSFLQRYIQSHQREVTHILAYLVQACHPLIPPDDVLPVIRTIANNFVTERCTGDVMAVGINSIKEVMRRVPSVLGEEGVDALVQDIAAYSKHRDKSVVVAARGFTNLIREVYPALLRGRDRGKHHDITARPGAYGSEKVLEGVDGADLLTLADAGILQVDSSDSEGEEELEEEVEDSDGWVDVDHNTEGDTFSTKRKRDENTDSNNNKKSKKGQEHNNIEQSTERNTSSAKRKRDESVESLSKKSKCEKSENNVDIRSGESSGSESEGDADEYVEVEESSGEEQEGSGDEEEGSGDEGEEQAGSEEEQELSGEEEEGSENGDEENSGEGSENGAEGRVKFASSAKKEDGSGRGLQQQPTKKSKKSQPEAPEIDYRNIKIVQSQRADATRILSAEDFEKIRKLKARAAEQRRDPHNRRKKGPETQPDSDSEDEDDGPSAKVDAADLEGYKKRRRATLEERLESVLKGREKFKSNTHAGGLTNLEKLRTKNFLMVRKGKRQLREKQRDAVAGSHTRKRKKDRKVQLKRDKRKKRRT